MKKTLINKKFWLQFVLPIIAAVSLIVGLTIGVPLIIRSKHSVPTNLTLKLENPNFNNKLPSDASFKYNSKTYDSNKYIKYSIEKDSKQVSQMVSYDLEYKQIYKNANLYGSHIKTLGDFINKWNGDKPGIIKTTKSTLGSFINSFRNAHSTSANDKNLPTKAESKNNFIAISSPTNSKSKNVSAIASKLNPYALPHITRIGMDLQYMQNNDIFNLINWPLK